MTQVAKVVDLFIVILPTCPADSRTSIFRLEHTARRWALLLPSLPSQEETTVIHLEYGASSPTAWVFESWECSRFDEERHPALRTVTRQDLGGLLIESMSGLNKFLIVAIIRTQLTNRTCQAPFHDLTSPSICANFRDGKFVAICRSILCKFAVLSTRASLTNSREARSRL